MAKIIIKELTVEEKAAQLDVITGYLVSDWFGNGGDLGWCSEGMLQRYEIKQGDPAAFVIGIIETLKWRV